jgi:glycosyltransferase involved in cell wall biosynthesis
MLATPRSSALRCVSEIITLDGGARTVDRASLARMNDLQHHCGPDEGSVHVEPNLGFSHRRLSIIDIATGHQSLFNEAGVAHLAWLPGERADVPDVMRGLDLFVLPSRAEGISNTILEAMACACPVLATRVGGNAELVDAGATGELVPPGDVEAMAQALAALAADPARAVRMGQAGRLRVEQHFSLQAMVGAYQDLYARLLFRS